MALWIPDELLARLLSGNKISRRQKAFLRDHLIAIQGRLNADEKAAYELLNCFHYVRGVA